MHTHALAVSQAEPITLSDRSAHALAWLCALLPFVALGLWRASQGAGFAADDNAQYLMHARALLEGRPYSDIPYITSQYAQWIGPRTAPPALPLLLAALQGLGASLTVMKWFMLGLATTFVLVASRYFARETDPRIGLGVALLCGLSPALIQDAPQFLTDLPFAAVIWVTIHFIDRARQFSWRMVAAVTVLGGFAVLLRPTGVALGGAVLVWAILRYRSFGLRPFVPVLIWGGLLLAFSVGTELRHMAVISVNPRAVFEWVWVERLPLENARAYAHALLASHLYPFTSDAANAAFHVGTVGLMLIGLGAWVRRAHDRFATVFAVCYLCILIIMPLRQARYIWPLYPVFVFGMLNGARVAAAYLLRSPQRASAVTLGFAVLLATPTVAQVIALPAPRDLAAVPEVREVFDYVRTAAAQEPLRVTFFKPRTLAWVTGVPAMGPISGRPECLLTELRTKRITHVIVGALNGGRSGELRKVIALWPSDFRKEFANDVFTVYRFMPAGVAISAPVGCAP